MRWRLACGSLVVLLGLAAVDAAPAPRGQKFHIVFVNNCDGLNLSIRDRVGVVGTHTGCGQNEFVRGNEFTTADGERGITVSYFDKTIGRNVRFDVFRTGFRAGNFYQYDQRTSTLLRYGKWIPAPPKP
jgi:hypothetical protein